MHEVTENLKGQGVETDSSELTYIPQNTISVDGKEAERVLKLMDMLEDQDDVQNVYANFDIDPSIIEAYHEG